MMTLEEYGNLNHMDAQNLLTLGAALNRYCLTLTRSGFEAEDLAQETWLKAMVYGKFNMNPNPEALLLRIAKNTWIDHLRRRTSLGRALERCQIRPEAAPEHGFSGIEIAFHAIIKHLSPLQRSAFLLRDVLGYSAAEAAVQLGSTEGAVKAALYRARQALAAVREELTVDGGPADPVDADFRLLLSVLASAYEHGQIPVMLELLRQEHAAEMTMAVSSAAVQGLYAGGISHSDAGCTGASYRLQMAA